MTAPMTAAQIRDTFLKFFESKGHTIVASSSLIVSADDPTLYFTNSGMVQFKDVFLGKDKRPYSRATTAQRCLRAGGKHNDLENVGFTARHHTFFEMLGNFSFADYFKRDAIKYAWELLTEVYKLPADKLWATVYAEDDEAYDLWTKEIGLPPERVVRIGDNKGARYASDNFWQMADIGPCGPCSEIFYDHGPDVAGGPPGSPDEDGDRYIEIWNNVFMQFDRSPDGMLTPLPKPCVDTGMGLERLTAVLQHVHSNYEIDLFVTLIAAAARETHTTDLSHNSLKVIADHIRACAFLIADGTIPGGAGPAYVLRRIIRRAIRHGYKLGQKTPFFHKLVPDLVALMGQAYPVLADNAGRVEEVLAVEEARFYETLEHGMAILESELARFAGVTHPHPNPPLEGEGEVGASLSGELAFKLHDTYGFPLDLTADVCRERGITVDEAAFTVAMDKQRETARAAGKFAMDRVLDYSGVATAFEGYEHLVTHHATVTGLYVDGNPVGSIAAGQAAVVVLDRTPFYAESGGQVGDAGLLEAGEMQFTVSDTQKIQSTVFGHHGRLASGSLALGDQVTAMVDEARRAATMRNHSVTHIMHKALREVLGGHVQQKGSLVDADKTRFDFAHNAPMNPVQIAEVESRVNAEILHNRATVAQVLPMEEAQKLGAMMLFGEKYGDEVRVLDIGSSRELCGGTHVQRTGDIGFFKITSEGGVAAGIRRVEAVTGMNALAYVHGIDGALSAAAAALKAQPHELAHRIAGVQDHIRHLEKELATAKSKLAAAAGSDLAAQAIDIKGIKVLAARLDGADAKSLRETLDQLKNKLKSAVVVLASVDGGKVQLAAGSTADVMGRVKAGELVNHVATQVGGKGGGKPDMAMAGGSDATALPQALESVAEFVRQRV
jgi:alanyl-tRNA synthetase